MGEGLVGKKPILEPGMSFEYSSGTPLKSPSGFMSGVFHAISKEHGIFDIEVPAFPLDQPIVAQKIH